MWDSFDLVGVTEHFDEFLVLLTDLVGLQAPTHPPAARSSTPGPNRWPPTLTLIQGTLTLTLALTLTLTLALTLILALALTRSRATRTCRR